jgi:curved DNA-binding protein CbpA
MKTFYDVLGARPDDDAGRLKDAYRKAVKANHPDHHAGDPDAVKRLAQIVKAYDVLRDVNRRAAYDRLLEAGREPPHSKPRRAASHPAYQVALYAVAGVAVGIVLGGGAYLVRLHGTAGDVMGETAAVQPPRLAAVEPARQADAATGEAPGHGPAGALQVSIVQGAAASAVEDRGASEAVQGALSAPDGAGQMTGRSASPAEAAGQKVAAGDPGRDHGAEPPARPRSTEPKIGATSQDETCRRDAERLAQLRISQAPDEVTRFERELRCEKLRPQVIRLRESVDPQ